MNVSGWRRRLEICHGQIEEAKNRLLNLRQYGAFIEQMIKPGDGTRPVGSQLEIVFPQVWLKYAEGHVVDFLNAGADVQIIQDDPSRRSGINRLPQNSGARS